VSCAAELSALSLLYGARIEATRRATPKSERAAAIKALRRDKKAAARQITERRRNERVSQRFAAQRKRIEDRQFKNVA
jgi:hypothetical protein